MNEMEELSLDFVADDRVAGVGEVDPDLVGAPGERFCGYQGEPAFRAFQGPGHWEM